MAPCTTASSSGPARTPPISWHLHPIGTSLLLEFRCTALTTSARCLTSGHSPARCRGGCAGRLFNRPARPAAPLSCDPTDESDGYPLRMPFYQRLGTVPRNRHKQFRDNGQLLTEEVMGLEGFVGNESILYHLQSPCRVMKLGGFDAIERDEWVPDAHAHRHFHTKDVDADGDEVTGRRVLMWNDDVEISLCRPKKQMEYFFRNGEGDEVIFVHEGSGTLETTFGDVPYNDGDYVVIPRGTTYRFRPEGEQR